MNPLRHETVAPTSCLGAHSRNRLLPPLELGALLRSLGAAFGKEVMTQMVWEAKKLIDI